MKTLLHLTSDEDGHVCHAMRSAALLAGHDELVDESIVLLCHRTAARVVLPDSTHGAAVADLLEQGVGVRAGATCFDALKGPRAVRTGVDIVPSGMSEVVRLQSEGYK
jgi:hypothetical protein